MNPTSLIFFLQQPFAQHALLAATLIAIACGLIGSFIITRGLAFAVHGTSELAFTGAAAGLLLGNNPLAGALVGAVLVAVVIGVLGVKERERDTGIGVILAFGLGMGILLLSLYHGFATQATSILFGNIFGVSTTQLAVLVVLSLIVSVTMLFLYRPLLFASIDPDVAAAKGVPVWGLGIVFLIVLALTVTSAAQVVGTILVLSLAITPAATAQQLSANPRVVTGLSVLFSLLAADGGVVASLASGTVKVSVFVAAISFLLYVLARSGRTAFAKPVK